MNIVAFILAIIAAAVFGVSTYRGFGGVRDGNALGLLFLTAALIVQFCTSAHTIHF